MNKTQNNYKPWEMKVLIAASGEATAEQLAVFLGRTKASISTKCSLMGVKTKYIRETKQC